MQKITDWEAKRAGGRITINGRLDGGDPIKVVGVDTIRAARPAGILGRRGGPIAKDRHGTEYELA